MQLSQFGKFTCMDCCVVLNTVSRVFWWTKFRQPSELTNFPQFTLLGHHFIVRLGNFKQYQSISVYFMLFPMNRLGK